MSFDFGVLFTSESLTMLAKGLWFTVQLTVLALIGGMVIGTPLAMMRLSSNRVLSGFAKLYVDFFPWLAFGAGVVSVLFDVADFVAKNHWRTVSDASGRFGSGCDYLRDF